MPVIVGKQIGPIAYGMMGLTTQNPPVPIEQSFEALRAALDSGCNFWNAGEFYGTPEFNSLTLLAQYFRKYPEDADKVVLSVKGAFSFATMEGDGSPTGIKTSIDNILKYLDGTKNIDIFECARVDTRVPIEETMKYLEEEYVKKGIIGGIALSEVGEASLRKAAAVTKIVSVEIELSLWSTHVLENGVAAACGELGIPMLAYSPIGKGMLTGQIKSLDDIPETDSRRFYPRFQPENFKYNLQLVDELNKIADAKGCTPAQLAIGWLRGLSSRPGMPLIIPLPGASKASRVYENAKEVSLTDEEMAVIAGILAKFEIKGSRYPAAIPIDG